MVGFGEADEVVSISEFDEIKAKLLEKGGLELVPAEGIREMTEAYPGLPADYVRFLAEIGFGDIGGMQIYSGLVAARTVYPDGPARLDQLVLFGDDYQGYVFGFDMGDNYSVVVVSPRGDVSSNIQASFLGTVAIRVE